MLAKFVLGPAGSGKTFRCLTEVRRALAAAPEGAPLLFLAPKQSTYQVERALLSTPSVAGYTRLQVLSFERLATHVFETLGLPPPVPLGEEGRLMVLRSILARRRQQLSLFRASTRLTGFAEQLALAIDEFQRHQVTPDQLLAVAGKTRNAGLALKLQDLSTLLGDYLHWLKTRDLLDANALLDAAATHLLKREPSIAPKPALLAETLWIDGFADLSSQETAFIGAVARHCRQVTITFCLEKAPGPEAFSSVSRWSTVERSFLKCRQHLLASADSTPQIEVLDHSSGAARFAKSPALQHLAASWGVVGSKQAEVVPSSALKLVACPDPEAEVRSAAREILRFVRNGGRYRDVAVLARQLPPFRDFFQRIFAAYDIPCFIDCRENVSHHPLAELTRSALRTVVFNWEHEDWFSALKTGLVPVADTDIDRLENEAMSRGWRGEVWTKPIVIPGDDATTKWVSTLLEKILPPFVKVRRALQAEGGLSGSDLAAAIREFWEDLQVQHRLEAWTEQTGVSAVSGETHLTVLTQLRAWVESLELAFASERLKPREWIPILEAGLSKITVGLIPPALDQVAIGGIDRSRNVEARLALVLGLNESVFPGKPDQSILLSDNDRAILHTLDLAPGAAPRDHSSRERHLGYLAFTRATERLVLSYSLHDSDGAPLNPSPFLSQVKSAFPSLVPDTFAPGDWQEAEHAREIIVPVLQSIGSTHAKLPPGGLRAFSEMPLVKEVVEKVRSRGNNQISQEPADAPPLIPPDLARRLYGPTLKTSVSRLEQFAACPFRFFVHSALDAKERVRFDVDAREKGNFQHEVLAEFHNRLSRQGKRWRDVTPAQARQMVKEIAAELAAGYRDGLLFQDEITGFATSLITEALQDFIETTVEWMRAQYTFDPVAAEVGFGSKDECPPWELELEDGLKLQLRGRIDRIDLHRTGNNGTPCCVIVDYKSSLKKLDPVLIHHGLQLQLLSYLNVVQRIPEFRAALNVKDMLPAGVFYVSLKPAVASGKNRSEALAHIAEERKQAYKHRGRFDWAMIPLLDSRPGCLNGDQFSFRLKKDGTPYANSTECLSIEEFQSLLRKVEKNLTEMGNRIYNGEALPSPYRKGTQVACTHCDYAAICRTDPWTQKFRNLKAPDAQNGKQEVVP